MNIPNIDPLIHRPRPEIAFTARGDQAEPLPVGGRAAERTRTGEGRSPIDAVRDAVGGILGGGGREGRAGRGGAAADAARGAVERAVDDAAARVPRPDAAPENEVADEPEGVETPEVDVAARADQEPFDAGSFNVAYRVSEDVPEAAPIPEIDDLDWESHSASLTRNAGFDFTLSVKNAHETASAESKNNLGGQLDGEDSGTVEIELGGWTYEYEVSYDNASDPLAGGEWAPTDIELVAARESG